MNVRKIATTVLLPLAVAGGVAVAAPTAASASSQPWCKGFNTNKEIVEFHFDSPELERVADKRRVELVEKKTGGPHGSGIPSGLRR